MQYTSISRVILCTRNLDLERSEARIYSESRTSDSPVARVASKESREDENGLRRSLTNHRWRSQELGCGAVPGFSGCRRTLAGGTLHSACPPRADVGGDCGSTPDCATPGADPRVVGTRSRCSPQVDGLGAPS